MYPVTDMSSMMLRWVPHTRWFFSLIVGWLALWMLAVPLVHVHPEADHRHGLPDHFHGGTYHTLLSSEPPCAFADHRHHHDGVQADEPLGFPPRLQHPPHGPEHAVVEFSFIGVSSLSHLTKVFFADVGPSPDRLTPNHRRFVDRVVRFACASSGSILVACHRALRAPPSLAA
ncbi:MAG: hypothetical protein D6690_11285 [Nitrospirae bacterium]|nr:MAG: hypothetical protein D6690_11285 [Nitrospirota bacterium]